MKVTSKGQVTIPRAIRHQAGFLPGSEVEFVREKTGRVFLRRAKGKSRGDEVIARLRGQGTVRMTTDEIMGLTRGED